MNRLKCYFLHSGLCQLLTLQTISIDECKMMRIDLLYVNNIREQSRCGYKIHRSIAMAEEL